MVSLVISYGRSSNKNKMYLVNWGIVTSFVIQRGLGILDLGNMKIVVATKWIYYYDNNREVLWRKVLCAVSKGDPNKLLPSLGNSGNNSVLWGRVNSILENNTRAR